IEHSELVYGEGLVMVCGERPDAGPYMKPPSQIGGANTQNLMVYVADVEAPCERARAAGAVVTRDIETHDYGDEYWVDRGYDCRDPGGHHWWFYQRIRARGVDA